MDMMDQRSQMTIEMKPIGFVSRSSPDEDEKDRTATTKIVIDDALTPALQGIEEWSHLYVIFWLDRVERSDDPVLIHPHKGTGIFATRAPIRPNPIGLSLVEFVRRDGQEIWVRGLDAYDGTPVLDIKPYPDWSKGKFIVVTDFNAPEWLTEIMAGHEGR